MENLSLHFPLFSVEISPREIYLYSLSLLFLSQLHCKYFPSIVLGQINFLPLLSKNGQTWVTKYLLRYLFEYVLTIECKQIFKKYSEFSAIFDVYIYKFSLALRLKGREQRELFNDNVYSFLLFVSSKPHYQAEF